MNQLNLLANDRDRVVNPEYSPTWIGMRHFMTPRVRAGPSADKGRNAGGIEFHTRNTCMARNSSGRASEGRRGHPYQVGAGTKGTSSARKTCRV